MDSGVHRSHISKGDRSAWRPGAGGCGQVRSDPPEGCCFTLLRRAGQTHPAHEHAGGRKELPAKARSRDVEFQVAEQMVYRGTST